MEMWDTQKADLRKQMRGLLKAVSAEEKTAWDREVCRRVLSRPEISGADRILGYMALSWETGTRKLLEKLLREGKRVALPRVVMDGKNSQEKGPWMVFFEIRSMDDLEEGAFHILEPGGALSEGRLENSACAGAGHGLYAGRKAAGKGRRLL